MKNNLVIFAAASVLATTFVSKRDELKDKIKKAQEECEAADVARAKEIDSNKAIVAAETCREKSEVLTELLTADDILGGKEQEANHIVEANKARVASHGFLVHKTVNTGTIKSAGASKSKWWNVL